MAIDTAALRVSSLDHEEVWAEAMPLPDGTISSPDRQHSLWSYAGILAPGGGGGGGGGPLIGPNPLVGV